MLKLMQIIFFFFNLKIGIPIQNSISSVLQNFDFLFFSHGLSDWTIEKKYFFIYVEKLGTILNTFRLF